MHKGASQLQTVEVGWQKAYRLIPSHFPPINLFENVCDSDELGHVFYLDSLTNDRLCDEIGDLNLADKEDCFFGEECMPLMAAFTHIGIPSRFTSGKEYGVYYAGDSLETAMAESIYHREAFYRKTKEVDAELTMRCYVNQVESEMGDIRCEDYTHLQSTKDYSESQAFASEVREKGSKGLLYRSVRHAGGECVAIFQPKALSIPVEAGHYKYVWNSKKQAITHVYQTKLISI